VERPPGAGKTASALQFLLEGGLVGRGGRALMRARSTRWGGFHRKKAGAPKRACLRQRLDSGALRRRNREASYLLVDELEPPGPLLDAAEPPLVPPLLDEPPDDEPMPPALLDEPPVPVLLEVESEGELGAVAEDDEEPPGTTTVSFSFVVVVVDEADPLGEVVVDPPGTTVVVSFYSHADSASAPSTTNR
jgi:hypothetical protein